MTPLTNVLRAASKRYRANVKAHFERIMNEQKRAAETRDKEWHAWFASLVTEKDFKCVLVAARKVLADDPQVKSLHENQRRALLSAPLDTPEQKRDLAEWLAKAILNSTDQYQKHASSDIAPGKLERLGLDVLTSYLIASGLRIVRAAQSKRSFGRHCGAL